MTQFKPGDVVKAKAGGPPMTVNSEPTGAFQDQVECVWFDYEYVLHKGTFRLDAIEVTEEKQEM